MAAGILLRHALAVATMSQTHSTKYNMSWASKTVVIVKSGSTPVSGPVKSGRKRTKDKGKGAGQGVSPVGVGDCLDSTTKDNER